LHAAAWGAARLQAGVHERQGLLTLHGEAPSRCKLQALDVSPVRCQEGDESAQARQHKPEHLAVSGIDANAAQKLGCQAQLPEPLARQRGLLKSAREGKVEAPGTVMEGDGRAW